MLYFTVAGLFEETMKDWMTSWCITRPLPLAVLAFDWSTPAVCVSMCILSYMSSTGRLTVGRCSCSFVVGLMAAVALSKQSFCPWLNFSHLLSLFKKIFYCNAIVKVFIFCTVNNMVYTLHVYKYIHFFHITDNKIIFIS